MLLMVEKDIRGGICHSINMQKKGKMEGGGRSICWWMENEDF